MKVTISKNKEWHKNINATQAQRIINLPMWQIKESIILSKPLDGWRIQEVTEDGD